MGRSVSPKQGIPNASAPNQTVAHPGRSRQFRHVHMVTSRTINANPTIPPKFNAVISIGGTLGVKFTNQISRPHSAPSRAIKVSARTPAPTESRSGAIEKFLCHQTANTV